MVPSAALYGHSSYLHPSSSTASGVVSSTVNPLTMEPSIGVKSGPASKASSQHFLPSSRQPVVVSSTFSTTSTSTTNTVTSSFSSSVMGTGYSLNIIQSVPSVTFSSRNSDAPSSDLYNYILSIVHIAKANPGRFQ